MTRQQIAYYAGVSVKTLNNWCKPYREELQAMGLKPKKIVLPPHIVNWMCQKFCIDIDEWQSKKWFFWAENLEVTNIVRIFAASECRQRARTICFRSNIQAGPFWLPYKDMAHKAMSLVFLSHQIWVAWWLLCLLPQMHQTSQRQPYYYEQYSIRQVNHQ